jgi:hypothetical protein
VIILSNYGGLGQDKSLRTVLYFMNEQIFCEWSKTTFGDILLRAEQIEINNILPLFFGNYLIKIGGPRYSTFLQTSPIRQKIFLSTYPQQCANNTNTKFHNYATTNIIQCDYTALPLFCESVDVALVHHALEFAKNPRAILEEVAQVLTPQGHVILIGFNPKSLFGLQHFFIKNKNTSIFKQARFINTKRITEWLNQLNFTVTKHITCYFRPYSQNINLLQTLQPLEKMGKLCNNKFGASYILVAEKKIIGLTPIKTNNLAKHLSFGYLKPSPQINSSSSQTP